MIFRLASYIVAVFVMCAVSATTVFAQTATQRFVAQCAELGYREGERLAAQLPPLFTHVASDPCSPSPELTKKALFGDYGRRVLESLGAFQLLLSMQRTMGDLALYNLAAQVACEQSPRMAPPPIIAGNAAPIFKQVCEILGLSSICESALKQISYACPGLSNPCVLSPALTQSVIWRLLDDNREGERVLETMSTRTSFDYTYKLVAQVCCDIAYPAPVCP